MSQRQENQQHEHQQDILSFEEWTALQKQQQPTMQYEDWVDDKQQQQQQQQQRSTIPYEEWIVLQSFYNSTNGTYWNYKGPNTNTTRWNFSSYNNNNPCFDQWAGIVCTCHHYYHPHYYADTIYGYSYSYYSTSPQLLSQCNVQKIVLVNYNLTGTITTQIINLKNLTILHLKRNNLYGTLPSELGLLKTIIKLGLRKNKLTGKIPASLGNLNELQILNLGYNYLKGKIPQSLGNLQMLKQLALKHNYLTGTIPSSIGNLNQLQNFYLEFNSLTGIIPSSFGNLNQLEDLYLHYNYLTGTIPSSLGNLYKLQNLWLYSNSLTGTIPSSLGNLNQLQYLLLNFNSLTGIIFSSLGVLDNLKYLVLNSNSLSGIIPSSLGALNIFQYLNLSSNYLTGTIPSSLGNLNQLQYLELYSNFLTGSIPSSLGNLNKVQYLYLYYNSLTGTIPSSLRNLESLIYLLLYSNQLHGDIINVFNSTLQVNLTIIQINNNQLTGSIPEDVFKLSSLLTFDAVSNCFSGNIPYSTICKSKTITNLILDGLHTATSCRQTIFPGSSLLSSSYILHNNVFNKLDSCLFTIPSLSTLHLSGNGFTGSLPSNISNSLTDLSLSHNLFSGTIPNSFQSKQWYNLDLAFNRITGILSSKFSSQNDNCSLASQQNRLSGDIPSTLINLKTINVLSGNIFSCDLTKSDIPKYDSDISNYNCGSSTFNISYYVWLGMIFSLLCFVLSLIFFNIRKMDNKNNKTELFSSILKSYNSKLNLFYPESTQDKRSIVVRRIASIMKTSFYLVVYIITILLSIYTVGGVYFGIYTYQYAWTVSIAFQSGSIAFGLTFTALCILVLSFLILILKNNYFEKDKQNNTKFSCDQELSNKKNHTIPEIKSHLDSNKKKLWIDIISSLKWTITPLINVIVVGGINTIYVILVLNAQSNVIVILQLLLASFKSFWNLFGYENLNRIINRRFDVNDKSLNHSSLQLFVRLLNNILIPCVVVAVINPYCFYNLIVPPPIVSSQFNYEYCALYHTNYRCAQYQIQKQVTVFNPPYVYSYQCSSQYITFYSVTFVFLCIIDGFAIPLSQIILVNLFNYGLTNNKKWIKLFNIAIPRILKLDEIDNNMIIEIDSFYPYFDSLVLYLNNFTYLGLIMTFGAVFPPLAASFFVTIVIMNYFFLFKVERFVNYAKEKKKIEFIELINEECEGCLNNKLLMQSVWMIITISCLFYSLFLFDTLGDAVGVNGAYWVLIVMPLFPLITYIGYRVVIVISMNHSDKNNNNSIYRENISEIQIVVNPLR